MTSRLLVSSSLCLYQLLNISALVDSPAVTVPLKLIYSNCNTPSNQYCITFRGLLGFIAKSINLPVLLSCVSP